MQFMEFSNQQLDLTQLPKIEDIVYESIERKYVNVLYFKYLLSWGIPFVISLISSFIFTEYKLQLLLLSLFFIVMLAVMLLLTHKIYAFRGYALREKDICLRRGILFHKYISVPFNRIQHITVEQGVFSRWFGLASLCVYSAAGIENDFKLSGITKQTADGMKQFILQQIKDDETN